MKYDWVNLDEYTSKNIPITKWIEDSTLYLAHGVGLFPDNKYYEFKYDIKKQEMTEKKMLSNEELKIRGLVFNEKVNKRGKSNK